MTAFEHLKAKSYIFRVHSQLQLAVYWARAASTCDFFGYMQVQGPRGHGLVFYNKKAVANVQYMIY